MFCVKCGRVIGRLRYSCLYKKAARTVLLAGSLCCMLMTGCGDSTSVREEGVEGNAIQAEERDTIDEEKAALEAELAETKAELAKAQEALAESGSVFSEEGEPEEDGEQAMPEDDAPSEEELKQAEYLENLQITSESVMYNWKNYKFTYYADDINKDGFPEVFMLGDRNVGMGVMQELYYIFLFHVEHWNEEERRMEQLASPGKIGGTFYSDIDTVPESGVLEFSYTADGGSIVCSTYSSGSSSSVLYEIKDEVYLYKDNEVIHNGKRTKSFVEFEYADPEFRYLTFDAKYRNWEDEESYNNLPIPECHKTVRLTARGGWGTVGEALEHLGELP